VSEKFDLNPDDIRWFTVEACPVCGGTEQLRSEPLDVEEYRFGNESIQVPIQRISLLNCRECGYLIKSVVPSPRFLEQLFTRQAGEVWADDYGFTDEVKVLRELTGGRSFEVLDIGASNGGLLKALTRDGLVGRRSALDVVMYPGFDVWVHGEFIRGFADSEDLSWSGKPYDMVTMFDVVEHLYDPDQAFANLRRLVKQGGFVIIETGDSKSYWPRKFRARHWWYAGLFEHHIFWSENSLRYVAQGHGFSTLDIQERRHKSRIAASARNDLLSAAQTLLYSVHPTGYKKLAKAVG
jgi:SAM-dependent methyltransferase